MLPARVGHYEVLGEVGRGGSSIVFRARSERGEEVAIKVLLATGPERLERFERERRLVGLLGVRDGFVPLLDAGEANGRPWLAMPFVPGGTLRQRLARGALPVTETIRIARAVARALARAHALGVVHRDLKPENILFTATGEPLVTDLGLGKHFDRSEVGGNVSVSLSSGGETRGTAGYMAPEQIADARSVGPPADVFALGAIIHECLAGRPAFEGPTVLELLTRVTEGTREPLPRATPRWLERVVGQALEPDPARRLPDGFALARALEGKSAPAGPLALRAAALLLTLAAGGGAATLVLRASSPPPAPPPLLAKAPTSDELARSAQVLLEQKNYAAAIAEATSALALDEKNALAWDARGVAVAAHGTRERSLADLDRAIALEPRNTRFLLHRARVRSPLDLEGALADATRATELAPGDAPAWTDRAKILRFQGRVDETIANASRAIELAPDNFEALAARGYGRGAKGDTDGALADLTRAVALAPDLPGYRVDLGYVLIAKQRYADAALHFDRALDLHATYPEALEGRGLVHLQLGEWDAARDCFEKFLANAPREHPQTAQVRDLLERAKARRGF